MNEIQRILAQPGVAILNVPSWLGKPMLELAAFRLGVSPAEEMDDHKAYYDPKDLWPMLVRAGFPGRSGATATSSASTRPRSVACTSW